MNIASSDFKANPFPFYARLRSEAPVYRTPLPDKQSAWLITRYEDVLEVLKDERFGKDRLRALVDDWLDSGRSEGTETPKERTLRRGTLNTWTRTIWPERDGLQDILNHWVSEGRFQFSFTDSGELELETPCRYSTDKPLADAKNDAIRLFGKLLQSSHGYRIAKCCEPQCGRYFYYERVPKAVLKSGTLCQDHRLRGGTIRKNMQRKQRRKKLLALAAEAWRKCKLDQTDSYRWIADQVNKRLGPTDERITRRFVTQNADTIEGLAGGDHAKS